MSDTVSIVCYCPRCDYFVKTAVQVNAVGSHGCMRCQGLMEVFIAQGAKEVIFMHESAPVPAPRLEWEIDDADYAATPGAFWEVSRVYQHRNNAWTLSRDGAVIEERLTEWSKDAAKSLAEKLNALLSPPVETT